jgi:hypothetical protein
MLALASAATPKARAQDGRSPGPEVWIFDRIEYGGLPTTVLGHPHVIDTLLGKAVEFNGIDAALLIGKHPLAGAETFTFEAIFRPDPGGAPNSGGFTSRSRSCDRKGRRCALVIRDAPHWR